MTGKPRNGEVGSDGLFLTGFETTNSLFRKKATPENQGQFNLKVTG
jgi:hypothetical protein